jgi:hypothetical protein
LPGKDLVNVHSNVIFLQTTVGSFTSRKFEDFREVNEYSETATKSVFNLAFGDKNHHSGQIDDLVISNNGDSEIVLATVVSAVYSFTEKYPDSWIYATGSTKSRNRLYRMGISKYLNEVQTDFEIYGEINQRWEAFVKEVDYISFLVRRIK